MAFREGARCAQVCPLLHIYYEGRQIDVKELPPNFGSITPVLGIWTTGTSVNFEKAHRDDAPENPPGTPCPGGLCVCIKATTLETKGPAASPTVLS